MGDKSSLRLRKRGGQVGATRTRKTKGLSHPKPPWQRIEEARHGLRVAEGVRPDLTNVKPEHPDEVLPRAVERAMKRASAPQTKGSATRAANDSDTSPAPAKKGRRGFQPGNYMGKSVRPGAAAAINDAGDDIDSDSDDSDSDDSGVGDMGFDERDDDQAMVGNPNLKGMQRSKYLWKDLASAKKWILDRVRADLGLTDEAEAAVTMMSIADAFAELTLMRRTMFLRMMESGGPFTKQGSTRAIMHTFIAMIDRELRVASAIGLEKKQRSVNPLDNLKAAVEEASAKQQDPVEAIARRLNEHVTAKESSKQPTK